MIAEILSTGDEIITGTVTDTNASYMSRKLYENGISVYRQHSVGDDRKGLLEVFKEIGERADICLVTGGLGPTTDDITAEIAAEAAGVSLVLSSQAQESIEAFFEKRKFRKSFSDNKQAMLPQGATCIPNPVGTAPGFSLKINKCTFFFMPGVPREMEHMLSTSIFPLIHQRKKDQHTLYTVKTISLFGLGESSVNDRLAEFEKDNPTIKLGLRAIFPTIQVKFYAKGPDQKQLEIAIGKAGKWVYGKLGDYIYSEKDEPIESALGGLLIQKGVTLSVAESCTGGLIAHLLTNVPGSSNYFMFSGVTYSNHAKINILGVSPKTIETHGAVSENTVKEMAEGAKRVSNSDYAIATSGIAGPDGGTPEKPVGTVCIGLASPDGTEAHKFHFTYQKRSLNKEMFAAVALNLLRKKLTKTEKK